VGHTAIRYSYGTPGVMGVGADEESRNEARTMPSLRLIVSPSGLTTSSLAVKSVSGADDDAHSVTVVGPVISVAAAIGSLL
jgi:hypothetical protein